MVRITPVLNRFTAGRAGMPRACFTLQVRPERLAEYRARHAAVWPEMLRAPRRARRERRADSRERRAAVWPEMLRALRDAGWGDYRLYLRDDGLLVGVVETDDRVGNRAAAQAAVDATEVSGRWEAEMAPFLTTGDGRSTGTLAPALRPAPQRAGARAP